MTRKPQKITDRVKKAWINPEFDRVKKGAIAARKEIVENPEGVDIAAVLLRRAHSDIDAEMNELEKLGITMPETERSKFKTIYERRFKVHMADIEREAILKSPEAMNIETFVDETVAYTGLDRVIEEARRKQSKDPIHRLVQGAKRSSGLLTGLGASLAGFLAKSAEEGKSKPSKLDEAAKKADEAKKKVGDKAKKAKDKVKAAAASATSDSSEESAPAPAASAAPTTSTTSTVESTGSVEYTFNENNAEKLSPEAFREKYNSIEDRTERHMFVLQQVAAGNASNAFEKLKITGNTGMTVEMEVDRSGLRVAGMDVQLDGPTAMAAAQITGCTLPTPWISDKIYEHAKANDGVIPFIDYGDIARELGIPKEQAFHKVRDKKTGEMRTVPDGDMMMSARFALKRDEMLKKYREQHEGKLVAGYFKDVIQPEPHTKDGKLAIYGGKRSNGSNIQSAGGPHFDHYADYSHGVRRIRRKVKVTDTEGNTREVDLEEFYADKQYADEFGFKVRKLKHPAYEYPEAVQQVVNEAKKKE